MTGFTGDYTDVNLMLGRQATFCVHFFYSFTKGTRTDPLGLFQHENTIGILVAVPFWTLRVIVHPTYK